MRIKQYVVTYNDPVLLNTWYLDSFFDALSPEEIDMVDHYVINNHTCFQIDNPEHAKKVKVLHNSLRPNFSTGHLARNWNQGLINGFKSLKDPISDIVILVQQDTKFEKNYINKVIDIHNSGIDFYTDGVGDQFHSYTPSAVKRIGLWDERFCGIGFQEADYILRSLLYHRNKSSVNDHHHRRVFNEIPIRVVQKTVPGLNRHNQNHLESSKYHNYNSQVWFWKYKVDHYNWDLFNIYDKLDAVINNNLWFLNYPYFEKDVETLKEQGFLWDVIEGERWRPG